MISSAPIAALPLSSSGEAISFAINAALDVTIEDCALDAVGSVVIAANLDATIEDCVLVSAAAQVGAGTLAFFGATVEDCDLESAASVQVVGDLSAVIEDCVLSGLGVVGSLGPFTRRPFLVFN